MLEHVTDDVCRTADYKDSNDPYVPPDRGDDECTTETFSSCRTLCIAAPTSSCSSTCSKVVGCDTEGTSVASTVTLAPTYVAAPSQWSRGPGDDLGSVASSVLVALSANGLFGPVGGDGGSPPVPTQTEGGGGGGGGGSPPAPSPTAMLQIAFGRRWVFGATLPTERWWFYANPWRAEYTVCDAFVTFATPRGIEASDVPFPDGTFKLPTMLSVDGCVYEGTAAAPGKLTCPDLKDPVQCYAMTPSTRPPECADGVAPTLFYYRVECAWGSAVG